MGILKEAGDPRNLGKRGGAVILKGVGLPVTPGEGRKFFVILEEESLETVGGDCVCLMERQRGRRVLQLEKLGHSEVGEEY